MADENIPYLSPWKNISANELLHPKLLLLSRCIMDATLFFSAIMYSLTIYVVMKKSTPAMSTFKYEILVQLTCNMCVEVVICISNPIFLLPLPVMPMYSHFPLKKEHVVYVVCAGFLPGGFFLITFIVAFASRVIVIFDATKHVSMGLDLLKKYFIHLLIVFVILIVGAWVIVCGLLIYLAGNATVMQDRLEEIIPAFKEIFIALPATYAGILDSEISFFGYMLVILATLLLAAITAIVVLLNTLFLIRMQQVKKIVSKGTFNIQKMLYKCLCIQVLNAGIFGAFPMAFGLFLLVFQFRFGSYFGYFGLQVISFHLIADTIGLLYFVKPYKEFVKSIFVKTKVTRIKEACTLFVTKKVDSI